MIAFIQGELHNSDLDSVTVRVGGVGLRVVVPTNVIQDIGAVGETVTLATRLMVRDDRLELYGFSTGRQAALFDQVQTVSGVGPRLALAILSTFAPDQFATVLENEDLRQLTRVSGLGKRTASRLILELRGKLAPDPDAVSGPDETADALAALGYSAAEIAHVLALPDVKDAESVEERIAAALRQMGG
jgi:Holliday junction DNA helicase RuvA